MAANQNIKKYVTIAAAAAIAVFICWYFRSVLSYIIISFVIALISKPLMSFLSGIRIGKFKMPCTIAALITLAAVMSCIIGIFAVITPLAAQIISELGSIDFNSFSEKISGPLGEWNKALHGLMPGMDPDFSIESMIFDNLRNFLDMNIFTGLFSSIATMLAKLGIALFSISFISFFFIKDNSTFMNMITAIVPDKYEERTVKVLNSINNLLVRYFVGITIEALLITVLNSAGLHFFGKMDWNMALVLAFFSGVINIIPYIGPLAGGALGAIVAVATFHPATAGISLAAHLAVVIAVYVATHIIDVFLFQPFIYSNSVKAHPLEIFIIILMAAQIGGIIGMLIAIPCYTAIRVIAKEFLAEVKIVQRLTGKF